MQPEFTCIYSHKPLDRPCEVGSCNFNLDSTALGKTFRRCLLNYFESLRHNPYGLKTHKDDFASLPFHQRCQIVGSFFGVQEREVKKSVSKFYASMFSVMVRDALTDIPKSQFSPVPYRQCAVCGTETSKLFYPRRGALPPGVGYCRYSCFQLKPPPIISLEISLEIDCLDLMQNIEFESTQSRPQFIRQIVQWIMGDIPMT